MKVLGARRWVLFLPALLAAACRNDSCDHCISNLDLALAIPAGTAMLAGIGPYRLADDALALGPEPVVQGRALGRSLGALTAADRIYNIRFIDEDTMLVAASGAIERWHAELPKPGGGAALSWTGQWIAEAHGSVFFTDPLSVVLKSGVLRTIDNRDGSTASTLDVHDLFDRNGYFDPIFGLSPDGRVALAKYGTNGLAVTADWSGAKIVQEPVPLSKPTSYSRHEVRPEQIAHLVAPLRTMAFWPGRSLLALGYADDVKLWDLAEHREVREYPIDLSEIDQIAISPDGSVVAVAGAARDGGGSQEYRLIVLQASDGAILKTVLMPLHSVDNRSDFPLAFSEDGRFLSLRHWNHLLIFETAFFDLVATIRNGEKYGLGPSAISPDGSRVAVALGRQVHLFELKPPSGS